MAAGTIATPGHRPRSEPSFHHLGIQTADLDNCLAWYQDFFGAVPTWTLDRFSELTMSRLQGMTRLCEMTLGDVRFHLFERTGTDGELPGGNTRQFQHVCLAVGSAEELLEWRDRWIELFDSGRYSFARTDRPTEVVEDDDGMLSFYLHDVNGLEFEYSHDPREIR